MNVGEKLFRFLARLVLEKFYGSVTIKFESGKVTHVETVSRQMWRYKDLPGPEYGYATEGDLPEMTDGE